ncbi:unnamed protein product [Symbiodinium sp. CCMP2592]|nr:unnamed protein product [Symbiodinium sp. CCMP2592]
MLARPVGRAPHSGRVAQPETAAAAAAGGNKTGCRSAAISRSKVEAPESRERRPALVCANVRRGEVARARVALTSATIAPGTEETFAALSDPARRPPEALYDVPAALLNFQPDALAVLTDAAVAQALRTARRGTTAGLSGATTCEHYKLLLRDAEALELFTAATRKAASLCPCLRSWGVVTQLVRLRAQRAPATMRSAARQGWLRRWWGLLSVALQSTLAATLLGAPYIAGALPGAQHPPLEDVLHDAQPQPPRPVARRLQGDLDLRAPPSAALALEALAHPCAVARKADTAHFTRPHTGLVGWATAVAVAHNHAARFTPTTVAVSISLSTEHQPTARHAVIRPSSPKASSADHCMASTDEHAARVGS